MVLERIDSKVKEIMMTLKTMQNCIVLMIVEYMKSTHNIDVFEFK
jgi:hypothetical protein